MTEKLVTVENQILYCRRNVGVMLIALSIACAFFCFPNAFAAEPASACPEKFKELNAPTCPEGEECSKCKAAVEKQGKSVKKYNDSVAKCTAKQSECKTTIGDPVPRIPVGGRDSFPGSNFWTTLFPRYACQSAFAALPPEGQAGNLTGAGGAAARFAACNREVAALNSEAVKPAEECETDILTACKGIKSGEEEGKKCKKKKEEAEKKKTAAEDKANKGDQNAKKNEDNAKKEGGMPQMPQIPQMPQQQEDKAPETPQTPTDTAPQVATSTKPEVESNKLTDPFNVNSVGFGGTSTNTATSTLAPERNFGPNSLPATHDTLRGGGDSSLGGNSSPPPTGSVGGGGGGGGSAPGGALNTTGASAPGEGKAADASGGAYEISPGGGGKLGAPKGYKGGGDGDAVIAEAAKGDFKADLGIDKTGNVAGDSKNPEDDPDNGYTIFKMVKYRYAELKKRGNI